MKSNLKHFPSLRMAPKHAQLQIFIQANITVRKKTETWQERPHLVSGRFIEVFYKTTIYPRQPLSHGPKSSRLYRFDRIFSK